MADTTDVLLQLWREQRDQGRQIEDQRAALTNIVIVVVAAGLGFLAQQGHLQLSALGVTLPMFGLGIFGAVACMKFRERFDLHTRRARQLRRAMGRLHPEVDLDTLWAGGHKTAGSRFPHLIKVRLYAVWVSLHVGIALTGAVLSAWILSQ
ncbi:hypothetical protein ACFW1A_09585 [Kitasatospora sp. NPDC058965]|uniref:hypothetical protein n=1 Tax=Kitasatospora sp. NPDC058965 TaxID=3346682 RepID=UPI00367DDDDC